MLCEKTIMPPWEWGQRLQYIFCIAAGFSAAAQVAEACMQCIIWQLEKQQPFCDHNAG